MKKNIIYGIIGVIVVVLVIVYLTLNKSCEVQINTKGGTIYGTEKVKCGETMKKPADPILNGYRFVEWYDEETNEVIDFTKPIEKNIKIAARYEKVGN